MQKEAVCRSRPGAAKLAVSPGPPAPPSRQGQKEAGSPASARSILLACLACRTHQSTHPSSRVQYSAGFRAQIRRPGRRGRGADFAL
jgi:hypothetical protein